MATPRPVAIRGRLRDELARRDVLTAELARLEATPSLDAEVIARDIQARAADLNGLLARHVAQARQVVRLLLESRRVCRRRSATRSPQRAPTRGSGCPWPNHSTSVVTPAGFEPAISTLKGSRPGPG